MRRSAHVQPAAAQLILASRSPARAALLEQIGRSPDVIAPQDIDETVRPGELPRQYAARHGAGKDVRGGLRHPDTWIVVADTVVACGRRILAATERAETARRHLQMLSGRAHRVWSAVCVRCGRMITRPDAPGLHPGTVPHAERG